MKHIEKLFILFALMYPVALLLYGVTGFRETIEFEGDFVKQSLILWAWYVLNTGLIIVARKFGKQTSAPLIMVLAISVFSPFFLYLSEHTFIPDFLMIGLILYIAFKMRQYSYTYPVVLFGCYNAVMLLQLLLLETSFLNKLAFVFSVKGHELVMKDWFLILVVGHFLAFLGGIIIDKVMNRSKGRKRLNISSIKKPSLNRIKKKKQISALPKPKKRRKKRLLELEKSSDSKTY